MRMADIQVGGVYGWSPTASGGRRKVRAEELSVEREYHRYATGVRVTLLEGYLVRADQWDGDVRRVVKRWMEPGESVVATARDELYPWSEHDEQAAVKRAEMRAQWLEIEPALQRLGLTPREEARRMVPREGREVDWEDIGTPGYSLTAGGCVVVDFVAALSWLRRIDPAEVAAAAIDAYHEALDRAGAGGAAPGYHGGAKAAALDEVRQGVAVSDAELRA